IEYRHLDTHLRPPAGEDMPLTPADVRNKQFNTTRLRPGYDEEEVDSFLDEVEAELDRLITENDELRRRLAEVTGDQSYLSGPLTQQQGAAYQGQRQGGHHSQGGNGAGPGADHASQNGQGHPPEPIQQMPPGGPDQQAQGQPHTPHGTPPAPDGSPYPGTMAEPMQQQPHEEAPTQAVVANDAYQPAPGGTHAAAGANNLSGLMAAAGGG